jgi:hypothetical protein
MAEIEAKLAFMSAPSRADKAAARRDAEISKGETT